MKNLPKALSYLIMSVPIVFVALYPPGVYTDVMKTTHKETLNRLARISGQVQGVKRMVEEEKYCIDIITQIQAARSALRSVEMQILRKHMQHCVSDAFQSGDPNAADEKMEELLKVMKKQY
jgi:DNA-binding FrmR family transcriptional regulator